MQVDEVVSGGRVADGLTLLRQGTAEQHRQIERQTLVRELVSPELTDERYHNVLAAFYAWYQALEPLLLRWGTLRPVSDVQQAPSGPETIFELYIETLLRTEHLSQGEVSRPAYAYVSRRSLLERDLTALGDLCSSPRSRQPLAQARRNSHPRRTNGHVAESLEAGKAPLGTPLPPAGSLSEVLGVLYVIEGSTQGGRIIAPRVEDQLGLEPGQGTSYFRLFEEDRWPAFQDLARVRLSDGEIHLAVTSAQRTFSSLHQHLDAWTARVSA